MLARLAVLNRREASGKQQAMEIEDGKGEGVTSGLVFSDTGEFCRSLQLDDGEGRTFAGGGGREGRGRVELPPWERVRKGRRHAMPLLCMNCFLLEQLAAGR